MGILSRAIRNISRRKTRSLLVIVVLSFALAMLISIPPSITASKAITQQTIDNLSAATKTVDSTINMVATQIDCHLPAVSVPNAGPDNQTVIEQPLMNVTDYTNLTSIAGVTNVISILDRTEYDGNFAFNVYGIPLDDASLLSAYSLLLPSNITAGRNLQAGDSGVVVLQERVANHFNVQVGGTVDILNQTFQVVGIEGYTPLNETAAYMNLNEAQAITNNVGNITNFKVFADNVNNVQSIANKIAVTYSCIPSRLGDSNANSDQRGAADGASYHESNPKHRYDGNCCCHRSSCRNCAIHNVVHGSGTNPRNRNLESLRCQ
jgi:hypothetical protein